MNPDVEVTQSNVDIVFTFRIQGKNPVFMGGSVMTLGLVLLCPFFGLCLLCFRRLVGGAN